MSIFKGQILTLSLCENDYGNEVALRVSDPGFAQSEYFSRRDNHSDVVVKLRHLADKLEERDLKLMLNADARLPENCVAQT